VTDEIHTAAELVPEFLERLKARAAANGYTIPVADEEPELTWSEGRQRAIEEWRIEQWAKVIPVVFRTADVDDLEDLPDATPIVEWARMSGPHPNLVIVGPTGTGKTHAGIACLRPAHFAGLQIAFYKTSRLLRDLSPGSDVQAQAYDATVRADRLLLDDLGLERSTEWAAEQIASVLDERWMNEAPTIVTSNLEPEDLAVKVGERVASRLFGSAVVVALTGDDRRLT